MATKFSTLKGQGIQAADGEIGKAKDLLFDDRTWRVRYVVVDTGDWLIGRKVLVSPSSFSLLPHEEDGPLKTELTKAQIEDCPPLDSNKPVSRQYESRLHKYYGLAPYWRLAGTIAYPYPDAPFSRFGGSYTLSHADWSIHEASRRDGFDGHLRSLNEVTGYKIGTKDDEEFGEVADAIIEGQDWLVIDLILNSHKWLPGGKEFVCSPMFVNKIDEFSKILYLEQTKQILLDSPNFDFDHYGEAYRTLLVHHYCQANEIKHDHGKNSWMDTAHHA